MTYSEAISFLDSFLNYEQITAYSYPGSFSLDRVEKILSRLGNPHRLYSTLHVAGTKGKGSTCAFAASILQAAGYKVGLYTSPHFVSFTERIRVNGCPIPEEALAGIVAHIQPVATKDLTYFEITTACAFLYFAEAEVDIAVIEVGLGGRLDATNVIQPEVAAITPVSLDHMEKLGSTVEAIAREKAGIMKENVPCVIAPQSEEALKVIEKIALEQNTPIHEVEKEVQIQEVSISSEGSRASFKTPMREYRDLAIPLLGRHQLTNAAAAIRMVELFETKRGQTPKGVRPLEQAIREGLAQTSWPGRCQLIPGEPPILLDGAQNAASAQALRKTVAEIFPGRRVTLILGVSQEKDLQGIASTLGPWANRLILTKAATPRAESPEKLAEIFQPWHLHPLITHSAEEALGEARKIISLEDLIVATGSLFLVGEMLPLLGMGVYETPNRR